MKIGKIVSVEFDRFKVRLFNSTKNSTISIDGRVYFFGNICSYLKTRNSISESILCEVVAILDYHSDTLPYTQYNLDNSREIVMKPIGTITTGMEFQMGVGIFPSLYSDVEVVTKDDLDCILLSTQSQEVEKGIHKTIFLGYSKSLINYQINLDINKLFDIHTAILGNSGSGKSNTIAHILQEVLNKENHYAYGSRFIIFDANGEYQQAFPPSAVSANITTKFYSPEEKAEGFAKFVLPYYLMNLDEWLAFLMASDRTQKPFWDNVLQECFRFYKIFSSANDNDKAEELVNYMKWKIWNILHDICSKADSDTSKMTTAKGAISKMVAICKEYENKIDFDEFHELVNFLNAFDELTVITYGKNDDVLSTALNKVIKSGKTSKYLRINGTTLQSTQSDDENGFKQIDIERAIATRNNKLESGEYFDYQFLQTAVELVLLEEEAKGNQRIREYTSTMLSRLDFFLNNSECDFMRQEVGEMNATEYLKNFFGIGDDADVQRKQLCIIDSSSVGTDILELMTCVTSRMIYDYRKSSRGEARRRQPVHLILDEAHRYIKKDTNYILKENIFEKIAREGRKFSMYLLVSSQRPSELSPTVLSQCGNYIIHRIQNDVDMKFVYSVLPYFSEDYIIKVRQQVPGEALVFGNCVPMPLQVKIIQAVPDPNSKNCNIREEWFNLPSKD